MKTRITDLLGCQYPVIQGGMAWVAEYHLAAAVSEAGGIGLIGAASAPPEVVREQEFNIGSTLAVEAEFFGRMVAETDFIFLHA